MVAGAHDIKIPWPGSEDSVQKRGVVQIWKVTTVIMSRLMRRKITRMMTIKTMMAVSFQHEGFDHTTFSNDISLLKLDQPLEFNEWVFNDD